MIENETQFEADWLSPPGDTIADALEEQGWSQAEFAADVFGHVPLPCTGKRRLSGRQAMP